MPDHIRQTPNGIPGHLRIQKTYSIDDVDRITAEFQEVLSFGAGAVDEWRKGLPQRGKDAMSDASRWERWEASLHPLFIAEVLRECERAICSDTAGKQPNHSGDVEQLSNQQQQSTSQPVPVSGVLPPPPPRGKSTTSLSLTVKFFPFLPELVMF